jgi:5-formyltetrahydrofolate cyclo-ligase
VSIRISIPVSVGRSAAARGAKGPARESFRAPPLAEAGARALFIHMTTGDELKADLRRAAFAARKMAHAQASTAVPEATAVLLREIGTARGLVVSGYMPIRTELDPVPAMAALHAGGARICVPVIAGRNLPLDFREWRPGVPMEEGPFGAMVPASGPWLVPDILIVPLVAFDRDFNRLGYGGGFYDRTLALLRRERDVRAIGFAFAAQEVPQVPAGPTDQRLDAVVTETGAIHPPTSLDEGPPAA